VLYLYQLLLRLYPSAYRREFAEEMLAVFRQAQRECDALGFRARLEFSLREMAGLLAGAFREQTKVRTGTLTGGTMRSFRFPRWILFSMVLALLIVLVGIEKAVDAVMQELSPRPDVSARGLISPDFVLAAVMMMGFLGLVGYVVRVVVSGSNGIQRLSNLKTWPTQDPRKQ
jgi:hypothetical protein